MRLILVDIRIIGRGIYNFFLYESGEMQIDAMANRITVERRGTRMHNDALSTFQHNDALITDTHLSPPHSRMSRYIVDIFQHY